ncbi:hypothetical protein F4859DRAFT_74251 [Xylaria cf. heliscus]|nr:hypothetical protein F4859DRAFT_74251 [Xylaria cf. heliscus]
MSTTSGKKRLRGCETCRERHIKCDRGKPCSYCSKKGIRCVRPVNWRFRHSCGPSSDEREFEFPTSQKWCIVAGKRLAFIDETVETTANHGEEGSGFDIEFTEPLSSVQILSDHEDNAVSDLIPTSLTQNSTAGTLNGPDVQHGTDETDVFSQSPLFTEQNDRLVSLLDRYTPSPKAVYHVWQKSSLPEFESQGAHEVDFRSHESPFARRTHSSHVSCLDICEPFPTQVTIFPLKELSEAEAMRYYINQVAPIFDLYDREMNFARSIPEAAGLHPMLTSIISTVATKHQGSFRSHRPSLVDAEDSSWCVGCLEKVLTTSNRMLDGCVLATIVLLRFLDVIRTTLGVKSQETASVEIRSILETQSEFLLPRGLHQAAFWAGLRQEIYLAILHERSTALRLDRCNIDLSLEDAEDEVWMGRITLHLVDVLEFCFGSREIDAYAVQKYESLVGYLVAWAAAKPESFEPLFTRLPEEEEVFPEIVFLGNCAMAAWHCYHLTRMLLIAHNPRCPRVGSGYMAALQSINNEIKNDVQILCGIAETPGNAYRACPAAIMGIMLAGDRFTNRREQQALLDFLVKVEENHAWPTWLVQQDMKESWGWCPS